MIFEPLPFKSAVLILMVIKTSVWIELSHSVILSNFPIQEVSNGGAIALSYKGSRAFLVNWDQLIMQLGSTGPKKKRKNWDQLIQQTEDWGETSSPRRRFVKTVDAFFLLQNIFLISFQYQYKRTDMPAFKNPGITGIWELLPMYFMSKMLAAYVLIHEWSDLCFVWPEKKLGAYVPIPPLGFVWRSLEPRCDKNGTRKKVERN